MLIEKISAKIPSAPIQHYVRYVITQAINNKEIYLPDAMDDVKESQESIGWNPLMKGQLSNKWVKKFNQQTSTTNRTHWTTRIIKDIWTYHSTRWKERCEKKHTNNGITQ
jgi:hypothetical protein